MQFCSVSKIDVRFTDSSFSLGEESLAFTLQSLYGSPWFLRTSIGLFAYVLTTTNKPQSLVFESKQYPFQFYTIILTTLFLRKLRDLR